MVAVDVVICVVSSDVYNKMTLLHPQLLSRDRCIPFIGAQLERFALRVIEKVK